MPYCLAATSHCQNQCWRIIYEACWHETGGNSQKMLSVCLYKKYMKFTYLKIQLHLKGAQGLNLCLQKEAQESKQYASDNREACCLTEPCKTMYVFTHPCQNLSYSVSKHCPGALLVSILTSNKTWRTRNAVRSSNGDCEKTTQHFAMMSASDLFVGYMWSSMAS